MCKISTVDYSLPLCQLNADFDTFASIWKFGHFKDGYGLPF